MRFALRPLSISFCLSIVAATAVRQVTKSAPPKSADWRFAGYRGTPSGMKEGETNSANWGGGELGPGIYVCTDRSAAWLYGAAQAQHASLQNVTLWAVDYDASADWVEPTPVPPSMQYERHPPSLSQSPHDVLINSAECRMKSAPEEQLPSQYKINAHRAADVRLRQLHEATAESAFDLADQHRDEQHDGNGFDAAAALPVVPVAPNGQCFYSAVAFHVKLSPQQKAGIWRHVRRGLSFWRSPFGEDEKERGLACQVRQEIARWLQREAVRPNGTLGPEGPRFLGSWHNICIDQPSSATPEQVIAAIADVSRCLPTAQGDPQLLWPAIHALYHRQLVVHVQSPGAKRWTIVFGDKNESFDKLPIEIAFSNGCHYDACYWRGPFRSD